MKHLNIILAAFFVCLTAATAQIPRTISYQGMLTDGAGNFIGDGNHTLMLKIYDNIAAPTAIYTETQAVPVKGHLQRHHRFGDADTAGGII